LIAIPSGRFDFSELRRLSERTGRPFEEIVELAEQRRLHTLYDEMGRLIDDGGVRSHTAAPSTISGREALRRMLLMLLMQQEERERELIEMQYPRYYINRNPRSALAVLDAIR
jgi:hypothetical protein